MIEVTVIWNMQDKIQSRKQEIARADVIVQYLVINIQLIAHARATTDFNIEKNCLKHHRNIATSDCSLIIW